MVSALAVVLGLMGGLAFLAKRVLARRPWGAPGASLVRVVGSGYVGTRTSVALVAVAGELLIVGTTATELVPLGRITDPDRVRQVLGQAGMSSPATDEAHARRDDATC
jgi:flagellar protein FliO/FliZ